ncbi:MAG: helix-turn-helix domain-containing protein, partial [Acutalibacteraceae bacterium]
ILYACGFESPRTFNRAFVEMCGVTPREYRSQFQRIIQAEELMRRGDRTPQEVARICGFADYETFERAFFDLYSVHPDDYHGWLPESDLPVV